MGRNRHDEYRKRSRDNFESKDIGLGRTLSLLSPEPHESYSSSSRMTSNSSKVEPQPNKKHKKGRGESESNYPEIKHSAFARLNSHVKISDLQNLALYIIADGPAPQWCSIRHHNAIRKVVVLMVPGLEAGMFDGRIDLKSNAEAGSNEDKERASLGENDIDESLSSSGTPSKLLQSAHVLADRKDSITLSPDDYYPTKLSSNVLPEPLKALADIFTHVWPIKSPGDDRYHRVHSPIHAMLNSPIPENKDKRKKGPAPARQSRDWKDQKTPLSAYMASADSLDENDYVLHPAFFASGTERLAAVEKRRENGFGAEDGWVDTNVEDLEEGDVPTSEIPKGSLTAGREVLAIDCEMCKTAPDILSLTRISIVGWTGQIIMDELVKPASPITDYLTQYSGMTEQILAPVTTTLEDIQRKLLDLIGPKTILVGHSLDGDFKALKLTHPFIVDTALLYPHPRGPPLKSSLKWLCQKYLNREIQKGHGATGHNSIEDARACLDLVRLKCEKGPRWGTSDASNESIFKRIGRAPKPSFLRIHTVGDEMRSGAVVDWGDPKKGPGSNAELLIGCQNDSDVVDGIKDAVSGENMNVDLVWARMRGLEMHRGWFNQRSTLVATANQIDRARGIEESNQGINLNAAAESDGEQFGKEKSLTTMVAETISHIRNVWEALPPCTAFIVYSGIGDPRELTRLQDLHTQFKNEYKVKNWDELSVKWTDVEEQAMKKAARNARLSIGLLAVK